jgi:hypothetical protein
MSRDDYIDVATRIQIFYDKYPQGSLASEYDIREVMDHTWIIVKAYAYRTPDDPKPGIGHAWEHVPGRTPYTLGSELMVGETSAWGRAIAALGIAVHKGIASAQEVRNAQQPQPPAVDVQRYTQTPADDPFYEPITPTPQPGLTLSGKTPGKIPHPQKASVPQVKLVRVLIGEWAKELSQDPLELLNAWLGDHQFESVPRFEDLGWKAAKPLIDELKGKRE